MTQTERILQFLKEHKSITQKQAVDEFGCYRLSARIFDLEELGHRFERESVTHLNRYGDKVTFTRYILKE